MKEFGRTADGTAVHRLAISGGGLTASIMSWGAVLQDLRLDGHPHPLVLGFASFDHYPALSPHFGAIAGRYANRIRQGRFSIDGERLQADTNFLGKHLLHGGGAGTGKRVWAIEDHGADFVRLGYLATDGEMGFPGAIRLSCTYRTVPEGRLVIELTGEADAPTLCNLAHHSYFNLDNGGRGGILDHRLQILADAYLPVDGELIPTGRVVPVEGTPFDFRAARRIGDGGGQAYDHNFCLSAERVPLRRIARLEGATSGLTMEVWSTEPGLQFYDGARVAREVPGLDGVICGAHAGLCLEPQVWPDSPNRPYFPQAILRPGEIYRQVTEYRFAAS
jgi:aldose 1-epimerase